MLFAGDVWIKNRWFGRTHTQIECNISAMVPQIDRLSMASKWLCTYNLGDYLCIYLLWDPLFKLVMAILKNNMIETHSTIISHHACLGQFVCIVFLVANDGIKASHSILVLLSNIWSDLKPYLIFWRPWHNISFVHLFISRKKSVSLVYVLNSL